MALVMFVGFLSAGPVSTDVSAMEKMGSDGVLVLSNGCWTTTRPNVLEPISHGFTDGRLQCWLRLCGDQVLGELHEKIRSPLVLLWTKEEMVL
jgi:hypothetical protein